MKLGISLYYTVNYETWTYVHTSKDWDAALNLLRSNVIFGFTRKTNIHMNKSSDGKSAHVHVFVRDLRA